MQHDVLVGAAAYGLPLTETLMPDHFRGLGYRRRMVGKVRIMNVETWALFFTPARQTNKPVLIWIYYILAFFFRSIVSKVRTWALLFTPSLQKKKKKKKKKRN